MSVELRALIRETAREYPTAGIPELARHVAKLTPEDRMNDFYAEALASVILEVIGQDRRNVFDGPPQPRPGSSRSSKVSQRRSWWADLLRQRVPVAGEMKTIAACTSADLQACIDERRKQVAGIRTQITHFQHLQQLLVQHEAETVADLPEQDGWPV